jgi:hypothetical protein
VPAAGGKGLEDQRVERAVQEVLMTAAIDAAVDASHA